MDINLSSEVVGLNRKTSSLNVIFNNNCSYILHRLLEHFGAKYKLPARNSEEPKICYEIKNINVLCKDKLVKV
jgi:hypothetical protein